MTKSEFIREYPKHEKDWDELKGGDGDPVDGSGFNPLSSGEPADTSSDYGAKRDHYYDRKKKRARIVHCEYKANRRDTYALAPDGPHKLTAGQTKVAKANEFGHWDAIELREVDSEEIHVLEFNGIEILYDSTEGEDQTPHVFDGFSIDPFIYATDSVEGIPYGPGRNLMDPATELNKAIVSNADMVIGQAKTGWIAERDAVDDPKVFQQAVNTTGSVAIVEKGQLTTNAVQQRKPPTPSPAAMQRGENAVKFFEAVSGLGADLDRPQALNEPATSVAIRYHKSQLGLADARDRFDAHLKNVWRKLVEIVARAMPDSQIAELLGNSEKYAVQQGMVIDLKSAQQGGQPQMVPIHDLRQLKFDIQLEAGTQNPTLRRLNAQMWMEAKAMGVPIPPDLLAEALSDSRSDRERLKEHAEQTGQQQGEQAQKQYEQATQQIMETLRIEMAKVMETGRHNVAGEQLSAQKQAGDFAAKMAAVVEKADAGEARIVLEAAREIERQQTARGAAALRAAQPRGGVQ